MTVEIKPTYQWPNKDPDEVLDYEIDWTARLGIDTISTSVWTITPGTTLVKNSDNVNPTNTVIWLSAGTLGQTYQLTNEITTSGGRTMDQTVSLLIAAK